MPNAGKVFGNSGWFALAATDFEHPQAEGNGRDGQWRGIDFATKTLEGAKPTAVVAGSGWLDGRPEQVTETFGELQVAHYNWVGSDNRE